jgi:glutamate-1-semialdehyde 2,1-aminomutase
MSNNNYSERLNSVIPGGAHTYSRGDDQYPSNAPSILKSGNGAYVVSGDDKKFLDYGMALRAVTLGYSDSDVNKAAFAEIEKGNNLTRASYTELLAAELLVDLIPSADMVKFAKNGSNVTTAAVKLARAFTGRKYVVFCAEQPFFSFDDWFIGATPIKRGIPGEYHSLSLKFNYSNIDSLKSLFEQYPEEIAAVIMEPASTLNPSKQEAGEDIFSHEYFQNKADKSTNFLQQVKEVCHKNGALFILDEMITGFRWHLQGAQVGYGVEPDLTTFGKAMANGFSVAALTGKKEIMDLGGIKKAGLERTFLTSTTHGAEMCGLGAFIKTVEIYKSRPVVNHLWSYGQKLKDGLNKIAQGIGIQEHFYVEGYPCSPNYVTKDQTGNINLALRTLFSQEMIKGGVLMPWIALSYAHKNEELEKTLQAAEKALQVYSHALEEGHEKFLVGNVIKPVFRTHN